VEFPDWIKQWLGVAVLLSQSFLVASVYTTKAVIMPLVASTATTGKQYVLNDTGKYDQVEDPSWQDAWKDRIDKAQSVSTGDVFIVAQGAGRPDRREH